MRRRRRLLVAAAVMAIVVLAVGAAPFPAATAVALLVPAAVVDAEQHRLPDAWLLAALVALVAAVAVQAAIGPPTDTGPTIGGAVGGAIVMALPVLALHLVSPASMGFGDVKASLVLGAAVGTIDWRLGAVALGIAAFTGACVGVITRRRTIPFGPFLVFGTGCTLLAHRSIVDVVFGAGTTS